MLSRQSEEEGRLSSGEQAILREFRDRYCHEDRSYLGLLFDKQLSVVNDTSKRKTVRCGRRSGKTVCLAVNLIKKAQDNPGCICVYIALSRPTAERLMWNSLHSFEDVYGIGLSFNDQKLIATMKNGSQIWLAGADDRKEREKLRGHAFIEVDIDEAGSFGGYMDYLLEEVLEPAMEDYDGTIVLAGTPPAACAGKFFEADTREPGWSRHSWTVLENPRFPRWRDEVKWDEKANEWLEGLMRSKGWTKDHPVYQREWLGRWLRDDASLVYRWDSTRNSYTDIPNGIDWEYVLGVDLGYRDATAFCVGAFSRDRPDFYVVEELKRTEMVPFEIAYEIKQYINRYSPVRVVLDTGGLGKSIAEEFKKRYQLPVYPAEKNDKYSYIEHMNSDMLSGLVKAPLGSDLAKEWSVLQYDQDRKKEDDRFDNHLADAALYAWRESRHYLHVNKEPEPKHRSAEWFQREAQEMRRRAVQNVKNKKRIDPITGVAR